MRTDEANTGSEDGSGRLPVCFLATLHFGCQADPEDMYFDSLDDLHRASLEWPTVGVWVDLDSGYGSFFPYSQLLKVEVKPLFS